MQGDNARGAQHSPPIDAWAIVGHLIAGMLLYGALGWLLGRWLGHEAPFIAGGCVFGMAAALYLIYRRLHYQEPEPARSK